MGVFRKQASPEEKDSKSSLGLRLNVFFFSTFVIFCVIIIRLAVIQFVEGPTLTEVETSRDTKVSLSPLSAEASAQPQASKLPTLPPFKRCMLRLRRNIQPRQWIRRRALAR